MARKSSIDRLPEDVRAYISGRLADGGMTLDELIADLRARWPEQAAEGTLPSRSAMGRYGQKLSRRLDAIKASTEAAKLIRAQAGDEGDARSEALTALIQTELFDAILEIQESSEEVDPAERVGMLSNAAKNIATLSRSSVNLKKFQQEWEAAARQRLLEEQQKRLSAEAKSGGLSDDTIRRIRERIMGIAA